MTAKRHDIAAKLRQRRNDPIEQTGNWLNQLCMFWRETARHWLSALRRRSQRSRGTWERFETLMDQYLPEPRIIHPHPLDRFYAKHPDKSRVR